ncbi:MAG: AsmA family protein [Bdellovibrionales bacterium]|nr:AsmA family protein [Bdellovibrionales bacterium]
MKKILIVLGTLVVLAIAAIVVIPMVVDVDQYRPQILTKANEQLNGKLDLGHLTLSLWGSVRVGIDGMTLTDSKGTKVVAVKDAYVTMPWTSVFGGSPLMTFNMNDPEVRIVKDAAGKLNLMSLMKEKPKDAGATGAPGDAAGKSGSEMKLPAIVANARLGVDIRNALFYYKDEVAKTESVTKDLNFRVKDLSLSRTTEVEVSGLFQAAAESLFKISGPFRILVHASPRVEGGEFKGLAADLDANFDDIEIQAAQAFYKKKGMTAQVKGALDLSKDQLTIAKFGAKFFNAEIDLAGKVTNLQADPTVDVTVKSNSIALSAWNELIPMLKDYALSGTASFDAKANGPAAKIQYAADLAVKDLKAKSPMLKAEPTVNVTVKVVTDKVEKMLATLKAPGNDLTIDGSVVSFATPKIDLKVTSSGMDLDQLVNFPPPAAANGNPAKEAGAKGADGKPATENFDAMLDPLRKNDVAKATTMVAAINLKMMQAYGVRMNDLVAKLSMRNLAFSVDSANVRVFDGTVGMKAGAALAPKTPTYSFNASVANVDLRKAVASQMQLFKNTVLGKANFKIEGSGSSFNPETAKKNLNAKGSLKVTDAEFASIDVAKMASEAINKALDKVAEKIPAAKGKSIKSLPDKSSRYEFIASDFTISGGRFSAPNFNAKAMKNQGLDLRGSTEVGLIDQELKADWEIIDTYNLTHARDVGFEVSGINVPSALAEGGNPVVIPVSVACKYTAPCPSYGKVPEHFVKVAFENTKRGATEAAKAKAVDTAKDAGKKLLKGLFH